jgi:hypothetical protein
MMSTMVGQLAGGASFDQAFQAGVKSAAISAVSAGVAYGVSSMVNSASAAAASTAAEGTASAASNTSTLAFEGSAAQGGIQSISSAGQTVQAGATTAAGASRLDSLATAAFWQKTLLNAAAKGAIAQATGGRFKDGAAGSVVGSLAATGAGAIGDLPPGAPLTNIVAHAVLGCAVAAASHKDCGAGVVGGAGSAILARLIDSAISDAGLSETTRHAIIGGGSVAGSMALASALNKDVLTAGNASSNEVLNNYLDHRRPNAVTLSEKERYERAATECDDGVAASCGTQRELAAQSALRDSELKSACNGSTPELCIFKVKEAMAMGNSVYGKTGQLVYANSPESGPIRFLNTATLSEPGRPDSFQDQAAKSTSEGLLLRAMASRGSALIGATTSGSLSIVGQYMENGTVRPGEVVIDAALGAANTWAGTKVGSMGNTALGSISNAAATEIKNQYYGDNKDVVHAARVGAAFGLAGYVTGNAATKWMQQSSPRVIYPSLNPNIPALLQPTTPNPLPGLFGTAVGSAVSSGTSLVPSPEAKK